MTLWSLLFYAASAYICKRLHSVGHFHPAFLEGETKHDVTTRLVHCTIDAPSVRAIDTGVELSTQNESAIIASLDPRHPVKAGERLQLAVDTLRLHAFDLNTGAAIGRTL